MAETHTLDGYQMGCFGCQAGIPIYKRPEDGGIYHSDSWGCFPCAKAVAYLPLPSQSKK